MEHVKNLSLCCLSPEQNARTCNYWYTVTTDAMAHTAFNTEAGLRKWMDERGLSVEGDLPERGEWAVFKIEGSYYNNMMNDLVAFEDIRDLDDTAVQTKVMSNAEFTLGLLTKGEEGRVVVNYLNVNVKERQVFDCAQSREVCEPFIEKPRMESQRG